VHAADVSERHRRGEPDRERHFPGPRKPETVLQAWDGNGIPDIELVLLQRVKLHLERSRREEVRKGWRADLPKPRRK
jgi:hypothetical protein